MKQRKLYLLILTLSIIICLLWMSSACAETSGTCGDNLTWELDNSGLLNISGTGAMTDYIMESDAPWYSLREKIKAVIMNSGITNVGDYAFNACENLTNVTIPKGVLRIGELAFNECKSLKSLTLPKGLKQMDWGAFYDCKALEQIVLPSGLTTLGPCVFHGCSFLSSITIPNTVTSIGYGCFSECSNLISIRLPTDLTAIEDTTFDLCTSLKSIEIPNSVTSIGKYAFGTCQELTTIRIPSNVKTIGTGAFGYCNQLSSLSLPEGLSEINDQAFTSCDLSNIIIPSTVTRVGAMAFDGNYYLNNIVFLGATTTVANNAVEDATPNVICKRNTSIANWAQNNNYPIIPMDNIIYLPGNLKIIESEAFSKASQIDAVMIPASVVSIADNAFNGNTQLIILGKTGSAAESFSNKNSNYIFIPTD